MGFDDGWLRTTSPTSAGYANARREVGRLVLKPPPSVSTLAFRHSVSQNDITGKAFSFPMPFLDIRGHSCSFALENFEVAAW